MLENSSSADQEERECLLCHNRRPHPSSRLLFLATRCVEQLSHHLCDYCVDGVVDENVCHKKVCHNTMLFVTSGVLLLHSSPRHPNVNELEVCDVVVDNSHIISKGDFQCWIEYNKEFL